jgi:hypothetical protein
MSGKRFWAVMIKQAIAGVIVVFLIGVLVDYLNSAPDSRSPFWAGIVACAIYLLASLVFTLLRVISKIIYLWLLSGDDMVDGILDEMRALKLPPPRSDQYKDYDYLNQLVNDDDANANDRVRAAMFTGAYNV